MIGRVALGFTVALAAVLVLACGGDDGGAAEPAPEATEQLGSGPVEQALARYVETTLNKGFVEDCGQATAERDVGKICAAFRGERANQRAYSLGLVFSEFSQWAIVEERNGQWNVIHTPAITRDTADLPGIPWPLTTGIEVVVVGGDCLNVRDGPGLNQRPVDCIPDGRRISLSAGPTPADNLQWWQVTGRSGWVAGEYLRYPDALQ